MTDRPCSSPTSQALMDRFSFPPSLLRRSLSPTGSPSPKDHLANITGQVRQAAAHLTRFRLNWPRDCLPYRFVIVFKEYDQEGISPFVIELANWLIIDCATAHKLHDVVVYLSETFISMQAMEDRTFSHHVEEGHIKNYASIQSEDVDIIFTMGGDGTVLNAAWMFQKTVPPIMTFHFGTVGFLSLFDFAKYKESIRRVIDEGTRVNVRMRLECRFLKKTESGDEMLEAHKCNVMNEVAVNRGSSPFMALLDLYGDGEKLTSVLADGLIIATTTGSTAYSMSAGGSVVHPDVPGIMITPICPHTLSLRPFIVPDSMELKIKLAEQTRSTAVISFDGRSSAEFEAGDELFIRCSHYPVVTVCRKDQTTDWFEGLSNCLRWNERPGKPE